jgi:rubredoxin
MSFDEPPLDDSDEVVCPDCESPDVDSTGRDPSGVEWFECNDCGHRFDEHDADDAAFP